MYQVNRHLGLPVAAIALGIATLVSTASATDFSYMTDWKAQSEHGGLYQALATGLYEKRGLNVTLRMGGPGVNTMQIVASGASEMATGSNSFFPLNMLREGSGGLAVMAMFQKDPQVLITHASQNIDSIASMKGMPIMISAGSVDTIWVWLKSAYAFEDSQIRPYTFNVAPFIVDETAIQQGYLSSEPFMLEREGIGIDTFLLADSGYPVYSSLVLVSDDFYANNKDAVQAFVDATTEGWMSYLYGDPSPANALIKSDNPEMTDAIIANGIATMKEYGILMSGDAETLGIGAMTDERWKTFFDTMVAEGVYDADLDYKSAYTLEFINKGVGLDMLPQ